MVWLVDRIKLYTVEAARKIDEEKKKPCTFSGSAENRHKFVAGTHLEKKTHAPQAHAWAKIGTDKAEMSKYRQEEHNRSIQ